MEGVQGRARPIHRRDTSENEPMAERRRKADSGDAPENSLGDRGELRMVIDG